MKVVVTGATGFIGTAVVRRLLQSDHSVCCLVRDTSLTSELKHLTPTPKLLIGDITVPASLPRAMQGCDAVINCAGLYSFWEPKRQNYRLVNIEGTRNVMTAALEANVRKVVHVSTVMAYGFPRESPFNESSAPGQHASDYAWSKHRGDQHALQLHATRGLPLVMVYLAAVVGAGDLKDVMQIRRFIERRVPAMIDSPYRFTYVHIKDAAEAIVRAAEKDGNVGERYLVGAERLTTAEYFRAIKHASGVPVPRLTMNWQTALVLAKFETFWAGIRKKPPLMPFDLLHTAYERDLIFDGTKAERELGITYTPLSVALREAVDYYRSLA